MKVVRNASIIFACSMAGNASNYLFQFMTGRALSIEDYGSMNALIALLGALTLPSGAVMMVVARYASAYSAGGQSGALASLYGSSLRVMALLSGAAALCVLLASGPLSGYLKMAELAPVAMLALGVFGSYLATVNLGMLQGTQRFFLLGAGLGLGGLLRLAFGAAFLYAGLGLGGAVLATVLPASLIFAATALPLLPALKGRSRAFVHAGVAGYSVPVLICSVAIAFLSSVDLVMAKHYLGGHEAGLYASVAVLGKTLLYLPSSFALALFPMVSESHALGGDPFRILDRALASTAAICGVGVLAFTLFPGEIIGALFGARFASAARYLKYYGAAMSLLALLGIMVSFHLARGRTGFIYSLVAGCVLSALAISAFHSGIGQVLFSLLAVILAVTAWNLVLVYRERHAFHLLGAATAGPGQG